MLIGLSLKQFTGAYSTVPPKSVSSITSFEPFNCLWQAILIAGLSHPPKEKYFLSGPQHPPKVKYSLTVDTAVLQGVNQDGSHPICRYASPHGLSTEDKLAAWSFYKERLEQYLVITHTPKEDRITYILFFGGKEESKRWTALKDQVEEDK